MMLGGVLERTGMMQRVVGGAVAAAKTVGSLISVTVVMCIGANTVVSDQYLSIVIPGRMLASAYKRLGLHPLALSRTLDDAGTLTSPLVPWNTCGAFMAATLGVATLDYLPYCFLGLLNPVIAIVYGYFNVKIVRLEHTEDIGAERNLQRGSEGVALRDEPLPP